MSICTESTRGLREPVLQVLVAARVFLGQRVNLQEKYDYPAEEIVERLHAFYGGKPPEPTTDAT